MAGAGDPSITPQICNARTICIVLYYLCSIYHPDEYRYLYTIFPSCISVDCTVHLHGRIQGKDYSLISWERVRL